MRLPRALPGLALVLTLACNDGQPSDVLGPQSAISDAVHGVNGNQHFYWLPPMLTPAPTFSGVFDDAADPTVSACEWSGTACLGEPILTIDLVTGLSVDAVAEWYGADWYVFDHGAADGDVFRVSVSASGQELGYADLTIVDKATGKLKNTLGGEYLLLSENNGKKFLQIRFRIEEGALSPIPDILFQCNGGGTHDVCGMTIDEPVPVVFQLTDNTDVEQFPAWKPDRSQIAYNRVICEEPCDFSRRHGEIWIMNSVGDFEESLVESPPGVNFSYPKWSSDGSTLYFSRGSTANLDMDSWRKIGDADPEVCIDDAARSSAPDPSPTDDRIVFNSDMDTGDAERMHLHIADGCGGSITGLTYGVQFPGGTVIWDARYARWSPDGREIAFTGRTAPGPNFSLYVITLGEPDTIRWVWDFGYSGYFDWSPDGDQLVVDEKLGDGTYRVVIINSNSTDGSPVDLLEAQPAGNNSQPAWWQR